LDCEELVLSTWLPKPTIGKEEQSLGRAILGTHRVFLGQHRAIQGTYKDYTE